MSHVERQLGHYRVVRELGAGGMGRVYLAEDLRLGRQVALKVLSAEGPRLPEHLQRFEREARALAALNHPNVVTIYSVEEFENQLFITMELVEGRTFKECIPPGGMAVDELLALAIPLTDALSAAHERGLTHRDLKPANVMLASDGRVKVLDFGLAKLQATAPADSEAATLEATRTGMLVGTLHYMSPEQVEGKTLDGRSDIFSLGVVMYEMATGRRPFDGETPAAVISAVLRGEPSRASALRPGLPLLLDQLIHRCLAKDPSHRPQTAGAVQAEIVAIQRGRTGSVASAPGRDVPASPRKPSIAVLPFVDMSADKDQEYFCEGMAEEILNHLAQLEGLDVSARTSSFAFKGQSQDVRDIGRRLGVETVLEGSVRRAKDRLRITAQLVKVSDGFHLWSGRFDRDADDIFAIQDEISLALVENLKIRLLGNERQALLRRHTANRLAYHLYLKGRYFLNRRYEGDVQQAMGLFEQAMGVDPAYPLPCVAIANAFIILGVWGFLRPRDAFARARGMAGRALELDPGLGEAHLAMALVHHLHDWDRGRASHHFRQAFEHKLQDAVAHGWYAAELLFEGRPAEARAEAERAVELEPLSPIAYTVSASVHVGAGERDMAVQWLERALELDADLPAARLWLGWCYASQGRDREAVTHLREAARLGLPLASGVLALVLTRLDASAEARGLLAKLEGLAAERYVPALPRALAHAALGDEASFHARLDEARAEREPGLALLATTDHFLGGLLPPLQIVEVRKRFQPAPPVP